ncbi:MAG TPA: hypothetical protein VFM49_27430 [Chloroflexia bacterium]|jgi:hypothetical protein|nr:hypothetical protein [Chloroflexia bacterium]
MNARKHTQQIGMGEVSLQMWAGAMELAEAANAALAALTASAPARRAMPALAGAVESAAMQVSPLLASAVEDGSNLEMDWLWLATKVTDRTERRYCLLRALAINPASEIARRELQAL